MNTLPAQNIPEAQKTQKWATSCVQQICSMAGRNDNQREKDLICTDLYNGIGNDSNFDYLRKVGDYEFPAMVRHIPIQRPKLDLLFGECIKRPNILRTYCVNRDELIKKEDSKTKAIKGVIMDGLVARYELANQGSKILSLKQQALAGAQQQQQQAQNGSQAAQGLNQQAQAELGLMEIELARRQKPIEMELQELSEKIQKMELHYRYNFKNELEILTELLTHHLIQVSDLDQKFLRGFKDSCIIGRERFYVELQALGQPPICKKCIPSSVIFSDEQDAVFVGENSWAYMEDDCTIPEILDEFGPFNSDELDCLWSYSDVYGGNSSYYPPMSPNPTQDSAALVSSDYSMNMLSKLRSSRSGMKVKRVFWKSIRRIPIKETPGRYDPNFKLTHWIEENDITDFDGNSKLKKDETVRFRYMEDVWKGCMIGNIFRKMMRLPYQYRPVDRPAKSTLPFFGWNYSRWEQPYSLIWATKDIQILYNIVNYHRELMLAVAGRKGIFMDKAQIPKDISMKEWIYQRKVEGVTWLNSAQTYNNLRPTYNQFNTYDDTLSPAIQYLDNMLAQLDEMCGTAIGVPRQRQGNFNPQDPVGTSQMSGFQSSLITEIKYNEHDIIRKQVLTYMLNLAKVSYKDGFVGEVTIGGQGQQILNIAPDTINLADYGIFLVDNTVEGRKIEDLKQVAQLGVKSGSIDFQSVIALYKFDTLVEIEKSLDYYGELAYKRQQASENQKQQVDQQIQEQDQKMQQMALQHQDQLTQVSNQIIVRGQDMNKELEQTKMALEKQIADAKNQSTDAKTQSNEYIQMAYLKNDERVSNMEFALKRIELMLSGNEQQNNLSNPPPKVQVRVKNTKG